MSVWDKMQRIDRRIIYAVMLLAMLCPFLYPLSIPLNYSQTTKDFFALAEALQAGDRVLISVDYGPGGDADVHPQLEAVVKHLARKGVKMVFTARWNAGPMFAEKAIQPLIRSGQLVYGESVANLGYFEGGNAALRRFGTDIVGVVPQDINGMGVGSLPIMQGIVGVADFDLVIEFSSGSPGLADWIAMVQTPLSITLLCGAVTVNVPGLMPYIDSGQCAGLLQGLRGAAEYELMSDIPGTAGACMDAQSLGQVVIIAFILVGNIAYFMSTRGRQAVK